MPFPFAFAWQNAIQAVRNSHTGDADKAKADEANKAKADEALEAIVTK
jgi:hypothetical protein